MSQTTNKLIAVLMLLVLPVSWSSAVAESLVMRLADAPCHEAASAPVQHVTEAGMHHQHDAAHQTAPAKAEHAPSCSDCGICHLACSGYMAAPSSLVPDVQLAGTPQPSYALSFTSVSYAPLLPPPLARA